MDKIRKMKVGVLVEKPFNELNQETQEIIVEARMIFDTVILINPLALFYEFKRGKESPLIMHSEIGNIIDLNFLFVRGTRGKESSTSLIVHTLAKQGCLISDPPKRFSVGFASKILSTLNRHEKGVGSTSYFAFNQESINSLKSYIIENNLFPLIGKPVTGSKGVGVEKIENQSDLNTYVLDFIANRKSEDYPLFLQEYLTFVKEYRVFLLDRQIVGMALKVKKEGKVAANAAQGGMFVNEFNDKIATYLMEMKIERGVYGMDVAIDSDDVIHIIENNRAPLWNAFSKAININMAKVQVSRAIERLMNVGEDEQFKEMENE